MTAVLDAGALIAVDRADRATVAALRVLQRRRVPVVSSAAAVAQVWRRPARQVELTRMLRGIAIRPLDDAAAKDVGVLLAVTAGSDVVDAHVALLVALDDTLLTSDPGDLRRLLEARGLRAVVVAI